jgi:hypothetical protein
MECLKVPVPLSFAITREWKSLPLCYNFPGSEPRKVIKNKGLCDLEQFTDYFQYLEITVCFLYFLACFDQIKFFG